MSVVLKNRVIQLEARVAHLESKLNLLSNEPPTVAGRPDPTPKPKAKKSKSKASL